MKLKRTILMALLAFSVAVPSAMALQVQTVGGYGPYQTGQGGEFTLKLVAGGSGTLGAWSATQWSGTGTGSVYSLYNVNGGLALNELAGSANVNNFETFCVEGAEYIYANTTFDVTMGQQTIFSGTVLTKGAAWLYGKFATGTLSGFNYNIANNAAGIAARNVSAGLLQDTIWALMGQEGKTQANIGATFKNLVLSEFGSWNNALVANGSTYGVSVLNLWAVGQVNMQAGKRQDQLILTSNTGFNRVPDGGMTLILLGVSLSGIAILRRRFQPVS